MDLLLYTTIIQLSLCTDCMLTLEVMPINNLTKHAIVLDQVLRQSGQSASQMLFCDILLRLRDGSVTEEDW